MPMTKTKNEVVKAFETAEASKDGKKSKDEYPQSFVQVLYIWYPIIF